MRALVVTQPYFGHFRPLLPLLRALARGGDEVLVAAREPFGAVVRAHGLPYVAYGEPAPGVGRDTLVDHRTSGTSWEATEWRVLLGDDPGRAIGDVVSILRSWEPDVVVHDMTEELAPIAAEVLRIPHACVVTVPLSTTDDGWRDLRELAVLRRSVGLDADEHGAARDAFLRLDHLPPSFYDPATAVPETNRFVRHVNAGDMGSMDDELRQVDGPLVLVSFGTVLTPVRLLQAAFRALRDEPVTVVASVGSAYEHFVRRPPRAGRARFVLRPEIPLGSLLERASALVCHGGINSIKESLTAGVGVLAIPLFGDQFFNADRCQAIGVGTRVAADVGADALRRRIVDLLADDRIRARARGFAREMADGATDVDLVRRLAMTGRPLRAAHDELASEDAP